MQDGKLYAVGITMQLILFRSAAIHIYYYAPPTSTLTAQTLGVGPSIGHGYCIADVVGLGWQTPELLRAVHRVHQP